MKNDKYHQLTESILKLIESGTTLNFKDFKTLGSPFNIKTKKPYNGFNAMITMVDCIMEKRSLPIYMTFKQIKELKGSVKKGEKGLPIYYFSKIEEKNGSNEVVKEFGFIKHYSVFNIDQTTLAQDRPDLIKDYLCFLEENPVTPKNPTLRDFMQMAHTEVSKTPKACYFPKDDYIHMPSQSLFQDENQWAEVYFHELTHWTGHYSRLKRFKKDSKLAAFGSIDYSKEELIAELGSFFLCMRLGFNKDLESGASYLKSWLSKLTNNRKELFFACTQAIKATDYLIDNVELSDKTPVAMDKVNLPPLPIEENGMGIDMSNASNLDELMDRFNKKKDRLTLLNS